MFLRQQPPYLHYPADHWFRWLSTVFLCPDLAVEVLVYLYTDGEDAIQNGMFPHPPRLSVIDSGKAFLIAAMHARWDILLSCAPMNKHSIQNCLRGAVCGLQTSIVRWLIDTHPNQISNIQKQFIHASDEGNILALRWILARQKRHWWRFFISRLVQKYEHIEDCISETMKQLADYDATFLLRLREDFAFVACVSNRLDWMRSLQKMNIGLDSKYISIAFIMGHSGLAHALMKHFKFVRISDADDRAIPHQLLFDLWDVINDGQYPQPPPLDGLKTSWYLQKFVNVYAYHIKFPY